MSDLYEMKYFMGMQVHKSSNEIFFTQTKYVDNMLARFTMKDYKLVTTPTMINCELMKEDYYPLIDVAMYKELIGILMYLIAT